MALLHDVVVRAARAHPDRTALVHGADRLSFAQLADRVARAAVVVDGLAPEGGRVAAIGPNHPSWVELYHGAPAAGRVLTFLNHRLSGPELSVAWCPFLSALIGTKRSGSWVLHEYSLVSPYWMPAGQAGTLSVQKS